MRVVFKFDDSDSDLELEIRSEVSPEVRRVLLEDPSQLALLLEKYFFQSSARRVLADTLQTGGPPPKGILNDGSH